MSLIDQALKVREQAGTAAAAPERFGLSEYAREGPAVANPAREPEPVVPTQPLRGTAPDSGSALPAVHPDAQPVVPSLARAHSELAARLVTGRSGSVSLEQYRRLAAVLHDVQIGRGLKTLMITSALPAEGKTLTVVNLALTLAESYARRVLIIDADLRRPGIHSVFGVPNGVGLSDALRGEHSEPSVHHVSQRLSVLTAGRPGAAPLAGLSSPRMGALIEECAARFDWVLLDTPPVGLLPDAQLLARLTSAVVLVIGAGSTPAAAVERAVAEMGQDCIIGTVLNRVDERRIPEAAYYTQYGPGVTDLSNP